MEVEEGQVEKRHVEEFDEVEEGLLSIGPSPSR